MICNRPRSRSRDRDRRTVVPQDYVISYHNGSSSQQHLSPQQLQSNQQYFQPQSVGTRDYPLSPRTYQPDLQHQRERSRSRDYHFNRNDRYRQHDSLTDRSPDMKTNYHPSQKLNNLSTTIEEDEDMLNYYKQTYDNDNQNQLKQEMNTKPNANNNYNYHTSVRRRNDSMSSSD